jgi:hypothetical protein
MLNNVIDVQVSDTTMLIVVMQLSTKLPRITH